MLEGDLSQEPLAHVPCVLMSHFGNRFILN